MSEDLDLMDDILDDIDEGGKKKLPDFLNVLTILTFIGTGLGLLLGLLALFAGGYVTQYVGAVGSANIFTLAIIILISNGLCLFGALEMRKLKKNGFYIYVAGHVAAFTSLFFGGQFNILGMVFVVGFIVMYGVNLKELED